MSAFLSKNCSIIALYVQRLDIHVKKMECGGIVLVTPRTNLNLIFAKKTFHVYLFIIFLCFRFVNFSNNRKNNMPSLTSSGLGCNITK